MIIYTVIGREKDGVVLAESSKAGCEGNFPQVTTNLLETLKNNPNLVPSGNRRTFTQRVDDVESGGGEGDNDGGLWDMGASWFGGMPCGGAELDYYFHVMHGESAYYICLSDDTGRQAGVNFSYLQDLQKDFAANYTPNKIDRANAYGMDKAFRKNIGKLAHHYNTNRSSMGTNQRVAELTAEVDDIKTVMGNNLTLILQRHEALDSIALRSKELEEDAAVFKKRSKALKHDMCWKYMKVNAVCILLVALIIFFLSISVCGPTYAKCRASDDEE